ncbi:hypothetical protein OXX80_004350 [Metschnikowia pulcherrima]
MSYFKGMLRSQNQRPRQEEEAIQTLGNRLQHATLAADRKSAVLGLKSFSRQYREVVVQYGLRGLLITLGKDADNAPLVKAVLETLLGLFLRTNAGAETDHDTAGWISGQSRVQNGKYPSPLLVAQIELDEFSNWIADEIISTDAHVNSLMLVLQQHEGFQIRLYALQLLEAVVATRPVRAKECILNIPLAVSTVVSLLDDVNDPIRNETILLLMAWVNNNYNIQKLVAFENTFERIFAIIEEEGGIRGSILVQDCMTLLSNLLTYNASNQTFFLETDCVPKLAALIAEPLEESHGYGADGSAIPAPPIVWTEQRLQNMAILLDICRAFVDPGNPRLVQNQEKLFSAGIFLSILRLVFSPVMENPVRRAALQVTGDIIARNADLQLQFAQIDVPYIDPSLPLQAQNYSEPIPAPLALLNWAVLTNSVHIFEVRLAAMYCLAKFFQDNSDAKIAFLTDQIKASKNPDYYSESRQIENADENGLVNEMAEKIEENGHLSDIKSDGSPDAHKTPYANIFTTLTVFDFDAKLNPYSIWFSAVTLVYLISDSPETRSLAREMKVGDAADGEEEMTSIQAISGMLIAHLENPDPRIAAGYIILLTLWLYEDFDAVNDFLSDASVIKTIVAFLSKNSSESSELIQGMASVLVGVCYDFSTKASPLPRENLYDLITKALGADSYALKVKQFKNNGVFRQFDGDLESDFERDSSGLPNLFFIPEYVELVKDNYYRIRKSLSRGPHFEPRSRISFEIYEEMENKNVELKKELEQLITSAEEKEKGLSAEVKEKDTRLKETSESLEKMNMAVKEAHETENDLVSKIEDLTKNIAILEAEKNKFQSSSEHYTAEFHKLSKKSAHDDEAIKSLKHKISEAETANKKAEDGINKMSRELFQLSKQKRETDATIVGLEKEVARLKAQHEKAIRDYQTLLSSSRKTNEDLRAKITLVEKQGTGPVALNDENTASKLRELTEKVSQMEDTNERLMEKLRSAAGVVQSLRADKSELQEEKKTLEEELATAYEELADLAVSLAEAVEAKEPNRLSSEEKNVNGDLITESPTSTETKDRLEDQLAQSKITIIDLQAALTEVQSKLDHFESSPTSFGSKGSSAEKEEVPGSDHNGVGKQVSESDQNGDANESIACASAGEESAKQIGSMQSELSSLRSTLQQKEDLYNSTTTEFNEQINSLKAEHEKLLADYESLQVDHKKVVDEFDAKKIGSEGGKDKSSDHTSVSDSELEVARKRIKDLEKNIEVLSDSASTSLASFKSSQDSLKARIDELEQAKLKLVGEIENLKEERGVLVNEFQEAYDELDSAYMDMELSSKNLEKHKEELEKQFQKLEKESSSKIEKLTVESEKLSKSFAEVKAERDELRREYYELEKSTNIIGSELQAKDALLQAISNKGADLAAKDKIVIEIKEKLSNTIVELGNSAQKLRVLAEEKSDLEKSFNELSASHDSSRGKIEALEGEVFSKSEHLAKLEMENKKHVCELQTLSEKSQANDENLSKIGVLESEISTLNETINQLSSSLDEQRKANCENSSAAVLEFTEKSTKLERSLLENQQSHDLELDKIRESTQREIQDLNEAIDSLRSENQSLRDQLEKSKELGSSEKSNEYKSRFESTQEDLEQSRLDLEDIRSKMAETSSELEVKKEKLADVLENQVKDSHSSMAEISGLKADLDALRSLCFRQETQISTLGKERAMLLSEIQNLGEQNRLGMETKDRQNVESSEVLKAELKEAQSAYQEAEARLTEKNLELETQAESLAEARRSLEELQEKASKSQEREIQQTEVDELKHQIERLSNQLASARSAEQDVDSRSVTEGQNGSEDTKIAGESPENFASKEAGDQILNNGSKPEDDISERLRDLQESLTQKSEQIVDAEARLNAQDRTIESLQNELESAQQKADSRDVENAAFWEKKLHRAESELASKDEKILSLQETPTKPEGATNTETPDVDSELATQETPDDLADLVLLCDHQEQKLEKYKRKLRALDIAVSSDEEDEDDLL